MCHTSVRPIILSDDHHHHHHNDPWRTVVVPYWISPWIFSTKQEIKWSWIQNTWALNELKEFTIPPAVVDYKHNNFTHINMFIHKNTNKSKVLINAGTPLINLVPMSDKKVKIHTHYDPDRFDAIQQLNTRFSYTKFYNKKKKLTKEKKCPFGF